ncbi:internalin [Acinetobacter sp. SFB]|uniref:internalin n=1 Tax=Acinetobacter sp. SFB TaxID=1805634 RepID=UPI0007D834B9|nr:internalin [Acinetobacter sp. SFB]OAL79775.1 internalin [Acinetobacter sp. SFB]
MNKKILICGAIAASLLLTACVKKEAPKEDEQEKVETTQQTEQVNEPVQLQPLDSAENTQTETPEQVQIERQETANTTTVIRREVRETLQQTAADATPKPEAPKAAAPKPEAPKAEEKPTQATPSKSNSANQSEDDAVAAAIAAATPALEN